MFGRMVESPGFDPISYGLSVACSKTLPPPSGHSLPVPDAGSLPVPSDAPPNPRVERSWGARATPEPDDTVAAPTVSPHRVLAAMAMAAAAMCDQGEDPVRPSRPACKSSDPCRPISYNIQPDNGPMRKAAADVT